MTPETHEWLTWDEITDPGTYVSTGGDLYVVPTKSLGPVQRKVAKAERNPIQLIRISPNVNLSFDQARVLAARMGVDSINF